MPNQIALFVDMSAHLDWDWLYTFSQYFKYDLPDNGNSAVQKIFSKAVELINKNPTVYFYSICEVGYLKRYVESCDDVSLAALKRAVPSITISGGGITSPDNLLSSGEGFIRNYLVANAWLKRTLPPLAKVQTCWIPDDFGHDAELPVVLSALGFRGVGFARIPGVTNSGAPDPTVRNDLLKNGADFIWRASDGSTALAHWCVEVLNTKQQLALGYGVGNFIGTDGPMSAVPRFANGFLPDGAQPPAYTGAPAGIMYIPAATDFGMPMSDLFDNVVLWNKTKAPPYGNISVQIAGFDYYITELSKRASLLKTRAFVGTPVWTGIYGSRMELKALHYEATRTLLAAEVFGMLAQRTGDLPSTFWDDVERAWLDFAPSTHHDYVTGTGGDAVYRVEQMPLLQKAAAAGRAARELALQTIVINTPNQVGSGRPALIANALGFARQELIELKDALPYLGPDCSQPIQSAQFGGATSTVQLSSDGTLLFEAAVPSFGYVAGVLNSVAAPPVAQPVTVDSTPSVIAMQNGLIGFNIDVNAHWGLSSVVDLVSKKPLLAPNTVGNSFSVFKDQGDNYAFGNEPWGGSTGWSELPISARVEGPGLGARVLEVGPLRGRAVATVEYALGGGHTMRVTREYQIHRGEAMIRMITRVAAPYETSVLVRFPLANTVQDIVHGTPYHWTSQQPLALWPAPLFRPTHDFVLPRANNTIQCAIYHSAVPGWAIDGDGALVGCLARNTVNGYAQVLGADPVEQTLCYALRAPSGLGDPSTGQPLREARAFATPVEAAGSPGLAWSVGTGNPGGNLPHTDSLAATNSSSAILTVAKPLIQADGTTDPSTLVLRLYQPTNANQTVNVALGSQWSTSTSAAAITALEDPDSRTSVNSTKGSFSAAMTTALCTVKVSKPQSTH